MKALTTFLLVAPLLSTVQAEPKYNVVDTNQNQCFDSNTGNVSACKGIGYDADHHRNEMSYTLSESGLTVTDNVTDLVWLQSVDINGDGVIDVRDKRKQKAAINYCNSLNLDGRSDWRLPDIKELYSLIDFSGRDASQYLGTDTSQLKQFIDSIFDWGFGDQNAGERIIDGQYATTTNYTSTTMNGDATMFGVNFADGRIKGYPIKNHTYFVKCVAGNESYSENKFIDNGDGTVSDAASGLMWQKSDKQVSDWDQAIDYCESSSTVGYQDWRLPNAKELQSIVDYDISPDSNYTASINPIFSATSIINEVGEVDWGYYWTSTTHKDNSANGKNAVYISFGRALGYHEGKIMDVHGAGSQRSNDKLNVETEQGSQSAEGVNGPFYYKGPQGDILRTDNFVRCVRTEE